MKEQFSTEVQIMKRSKYLKGIQKIVKMTKPENSGEM